MDNSKTVRKWNCIFGLMLLIQVIWLIYFWFFTDPATTADHDYMNMVYHFREVLNQKTLALPDWHAATTLEIDTPFLFALPILAAGGSTAVVTGVGNLLMTVLYAGCIYGILALAGVRQPIRLLTVTMVITPYAYGMLEYFNMLFFNGGQYTVKVITPLLLVLLYLWVDLEETRVRNILRYAVWILYLAFSFTTALSSGIYTMMCGILPVCAGILITLWIQEDWKVALSRKKIALLVSTFIVYAPGMLFHGRLLPGHDRNHMHLALLDRVISNVEATFLGLFQAFGATTGEPVEIMSPQGIWLCCKILFVVVLLISWLVSLQAIVHKSPPLQTNVADSVRSAAGTLLSTQFTLVIVILLLADTRYSGNLLMEYRYHLIGIVPLIVLSGIVLDTTLNRLRHPKKAVALSITVLFCMLIVLGNMVYTFRHRDRSGYLTEMREYFHTLNVESVIFINDQNDADICRGLDPMIKYGNFQTDTQTLSLSYNSFYASTTGAWYGNRNALVLVEGQTLSDLLPEVIASQYQYAGKTKWMDVYVSDHVYFP